MLMAYLVLRARLVPFVHDECSFFPYIQSGKFLPGENGWDANNHFLNSAISYFFYRIFGSSELSLRLANLIFFPLFALYWYKLASLLDSAFIRRVFLISGLFAHNKIGRAL